MGILRTDVISHSQLSDGNGSVLFDGTTDSITIPSNSALAFRTNDWTVEGWFYFTDLVGDGNGQQTLVGDTYGNTAGFYIYKQINHRLGVYYSSLLVDGTATIEADRWYHLFRRPALDGMRSQVFSAQSFVVEKFPARIH